MKDIEKLDLSPASHAKQQLPLPKQPKHFKRFGASSADYFIAIFLRFFIAIPLHEIILKKGFYEMQSFMQTAPHASFIEILHKAQSIGLISNVMIFAILLVTIGSLYYIILWSSAKSATFGMRLYRIKLVDSNTFGRISFARAVARYYLSIVQFVIPILVAIMLYLGLINVIFAILVVLFLCWNEFSLFRQKKQTLHDFLTKTLLICK